MRNLSLVIEYDGAAYAGWQRQPDRPTVQAALEEAAAAILRERTTVHGAGRTDAGVHARGQVANFRTSSALDPSRIARGLNALLPPDIAVLSCREADPSFHARFDAVARRYSYVISTVPPALDRGRVWHLRAALDPGPMGEAAAAVRGEHDFSSFCRADAAAVNRRCVVTAAGWTGAGGRLTFSITANRFLHGMVRSLVGTMADVGRGHTTIDAFLRMLASADRRDGGPAAPACGLTLEEVLYR